MCLKTIKILSRHICTYNKKIVVFYLRQLLFVHGCLYTRTRKNFNIMENLELITPFNDIVLPTAWDAENSSPFINIDSSGLKCWIFYFEIKIINKGKNGMIGIGCCTKQNDKEIDDSIIKTDYINNILMPGQESKENELWGCGYHGDDGYSFCSGGVEPYGPKYTTGDIIGCYLNFVNKMVFYTKNGINLGN
ncbi:hypothetical protein C2G38_1319711 [Gigaspora rosea]|uniref:B30.2/SPRY domain-containing protein n=1 Tax=Gigaspora rosea TaxID=44941 RepID=A0A397VBX1_9GLOM|nr:hypothetical protein C2G38_1319711 [Gigaspora rosea]